MLAAIPPFEQVSDRQPRTHYQDVLRDFCRQHGIAFVDLLDPLTDADPLRAYWDWDPHFTPYGHEVVADALYRATAHVLTDAAR